MPELKLTLTCADYPRLFPLAARMVAAKDIDLTLELSRGGSWAGRAEMLRRALHDPNVQGGEQSMAGQLQRIDAGDRSHVGLPVFPLRNFTARDLYIRAGGPIRAPEDLAGKRIGIYGWANSGSVWYRHFLRYLGLDIDAMRWWVGPIDSPRPSTVSTTLPAHVKEPPAGASLSDMLISGELDAIYSPPRPQRYHPTNGPIARLFPQFRPVEQEYFRKTGAFPPQHLIVIRRAVWEANKWIAKSLTDAFIAGNDEYTAAQRDFPYGTPWEEAELEQTRPLLGDDFHPYGFEKNRAQMVMFCETAFAAGMTRRLITPEEYFEEFLGS
jgi:4,5-dihydroxyphthalate decarboxylase